MNSKVLGGILLVVGTSIGGGMLALPIASAGGGFIASTVLLILCWLAMMIPAFLILEVNLWLPPKTNIISMAKATLGKGGAVVAWITYLLLLYSLMSAYIAGGTDILHNLISGVHLKIPLWLSSCIFVLILGAIICNGMKAVDYANRGLMFVKFITYGLLVLFALPFTQSINLTGGQPLLLTGSITVMITSYGFATIVPSLRDYFHDDVQQLRKVILIGSCIPLICYILWNLAIIGVLPGTGPDSLQQMMTSGSSTSDLVNALTQQLHSRWITDFAHLFVSICVMTSFLAVSLGLSDFLADGLQVRKEGKGAALVYALVFLPPLIIVLFYPGLFIKGLSYAGICCVILLMLLPALMAWRGRYHLNLAKAYRVAGGKVILAIIALVALGILGLTIAKL